MLILVILLIFHILSWAVLKLLKSPSLQLLRNMLIMVKPRTPLYLAIVREGGPDRFGFGQGVAEVDEEVTVELVGDRIIFGTHGHHIV